MEQRSTWDAPNVEKKTGSGLPPITYHDAFEITEKMSKGQVTSAQWFNEMRERLLLMGEMEKE